MQAVAGLGPSGSPGINFRQLQYFVKVVELGNITRASEQLRIAQPALGLQIRQLEESLGVELLQRHSRGVEPTQAGKLLFERAVRILRDVEDARREVMASGERRAEPVKLGLTPSLMRLVGTEILVRARDELPQLSLQLVEELSFGLLDAMDRNEIDVALAYEADARTTLDRKPIFEEELLFVSAPMAGAAPTVSFAEVLESRLALAGGKDAVWRLAAAAAARLSMPFRVSYEAQSIEAMKELVRQGIAASILPYGTAVREIKSGELLARRIADAPLKRVLYLVRNKASSASARHSAALERFLLEILGRAADEIPITAWLTAKP